ncbi:outer membrane beta-barrel protein [Ulvibacterium marinum]|uniref:Outer membrane protein beta-barrel domain-containing protein n=1 Tax=Ulvibacterium marinum TaxID=2419782 RepID=A0A3B0C4Z1_9FLAO|nr:outer membrane beta-barrel protein [Ulvibacterium marinum]RKN81365.1 hypothetical protein D7Z94_10560 [Ulvibacterium marinum]
MKVNHCKRINAYFIFVLFLLLSFPLQAQQNKSQDSLHTPFRKGRWLTGLSGNISSNTNKERSSDVKLITNEFGLNLSTGKFIKDRWLLGGNLRADRGSSSGNIDRTTESLFLGPFTSYYLTENERGSLFAKLSSGYVRYGEETSFNDLNNPIQEISEGDGFGVLIGLGYSYVINDQIAFDIGFDLNLFWVGIDQEQQPSGIIDSQNISISNTAFSFGFNVILDDFFF